MHVHLDDDYWYLEDIGDVEWFMLVQLPQAADFKQSEKGRKRLLPDPTDEEGEDEFVVDWKQFVQPDIETQFTRDLELVSADLDEAEEREDGDGNAVHQLQVPITHAETWYSVLNQARLILNEEYKITSTEQGLMAGLQAPTEIDEEKWLVMVQFRVYAAIQEFLLSNFME